MEKLKSKLAKLQSKIESCEKSANDLVNASKSDNFSAAIAAKRKTLDKQNFELNKALSEITEAVYNFEGQETALELLEIIDSCSDKLSSVSFIIEDYDKNKVFFDKLLPLVDKLFILVDLVETNQSINNGLFILNELKSEIDTALLEKYCVYNNSCEKKVKELDALIVDIKSKCNYVYKHLLTTGESIGGKATNNQSELPKIAAVTATAISPPKFEPSILTSFSGKIEDYPAWKKCYLSRIEQWSGLSDKVKLNWLVNKDILKDPLTYQSVQDCDNISEAWQILDSLYLSNSRLLMGIYNEWNGKTKLTNIDEFYNVYNNFKSTLVTIKSICLSDSDMTLKSASFPLYVRLKDIAPPKIQEEIIFSIGHKIDLTIWDNIFEKYAKLSLASETKKTPDIKSKNAQRSFAVVNTNVKCGFCGDGHYMDRCQAFINLSVEDRSDYVANRGLCKLCFRDHGDYECRRKAQMGVCSIDGCQEFHNRTLHNSVATPQPSLSSLLCVNLCKDEGKEAAVTLHNPSSRSTPEAVTPIKTPSHSTPQAVIQKPSPLYHTPHPFNPIGTPIATSHTHLLQSVKVYSSDRDARMNSVLTIFDGGSNTCLIKLDIAEKFNLSYKDCKQPITTAGGGSFMANKVFKVPIITTNGGIIVVDAYGVTSIGTRMSTTPAKSACEMFPKLSTSDLDEVTMEEPELLVGVIDVKLVPKELQRTDNAILFQTCFGKGYIVVSMSQNNSRSKCALKFDNDVTPMESSNIGRETHSDNNIDAG